MPQTRILTIAAMAACGIALLHCGSSNNGSHSNPDSGAPDSTAPDGGTPGSDAESAGDADGGVDATVDDAGDAAPDAPVAILVCNQQACAASQFCGTVASDAGAGGVDAGDADAGDGGDASDAGAVTSGLQCENAVFSNVCNNPSGTVFFDGIDVDNAAASTLGAALGSTCRMAVTSPEAGPTDPDSGEPLTGIGNLCIIAGGGSGQAAVRFIDNASQSDVILRGIYDDGGVFDLRFTQEVGSGAPQDLASIAYSGLPVMTDYFLVELTVDPGTGSLCMAVIGMNGEGTAAGSYFVANQFLANGAYKTSAKSWYVYYWASGTDGGAPSSADTFTLVASGP